MKTRILQILLLAICCSTSFASEQETSEKKNPYLGRIDQPREHCLYRSCSGEVVEKSRVQLASDPKDCE